jgi:hypothetical protein
MEPTVMMAVVALLLASLKSAGSRRLKGCVNSR